MAKRSVPQRTVMVQVERPKGHVVVRRVDQDWAEGGTMSYVISVWNCRAVVSKRVIHEGGTWSYLEADNWEELEDEAIEAVEDFGGAINVSGLYPCPLDLAEKGRWIEEPCPRP